MHSSPSAATARCCAARASSTGGEVPILGVNLGRVGFLTGVQRADLGRAVEALVRQDYHVERRLTLTATVSLA